MYLLLVRKVIQQATAIKLITTQVCSSTCLSQALAVHSWTLLIPCCLQAAKTLGMVSVDVPGAGETDTQTVQSLVSKKTSTATPAAAVPVETILVPATPVATVPPVAVSGMGDSHLFYALLLLLKRKTAVHILFVAALLLRFAQIFSVGKHRLKMGQLQTMQMFDVSSCTCGCYVSCHCCCSELSLLLQCAVGGKSAPFYTALLRQ